MSSDASMTPRIKEPPPLDGLRMIPGTTQQIPADDTKALQVLILAHIKRAKEGHHESMYMLGVLFEHLRSEDEVNDESAKWYLRAAQGGHADAMYQLPLCYQCGYGVERNDVEAVEWFRKAMKCQHVPSLTRMGAAYLSGEGVGRDKEQAIMHFTAAALKGEPKAQVILATCLQELNDPAAEKEAFKWYLKAAEASEASAMFEIGRMLVEGKGTDQNRQMGIQWLTRAAEEGEEEAESYLDGLRDRDGRRDVSS